MDVTAKRQREKETVSLMISIYCRKNTMGRRFAPIAPSRRKFNPVGTGSEKLYSQADNAEWAGDFFARQGDLTQEYWMYFKENQRSMAEKYPSRRRWMSCGYSF